MAGIIREGKEEIMLDVCAGWMPYLVLITCLPDAEISCTELKSGYLSAKKWT